MNLTKERTYFISIDIENNDDTGLGNNTVELTFTNKELIHAIITCGLPIQRLTRAFDKKRSSEILYKTLVVETALEESGDHLKKSADTLYLDSSEKSMMSYYLGMFFTKLISKKLYEVDYLTNLNTIRGEDGYLDYFCGKWRPDMIGYKVADDVWSVWEAKGGSNRRAPALKLGCEQAGDIQSVNEKCPQPAAVCMTYYDHGYLTAVVKHTESKDGKAVHFAKEAFYKAYYEGIRELFVEYGNTMNWEDGNVEITVELPNHNKNYRKVRVGISEQLFQKIMKEQYGEIEEIDRVPINKYQDERFVGGDGIYIK